MEPKHENASVRPTKTVRRQTEARRQPCSYRKRRASPPAPRPSDRVFYVRFGHAAFRDRVAQQFEFGVLALGYNQHFHPLSLTERQWLFQDETLWIVDRHGFFVRVHGLALLLNHCRGFDMTRFEQN